MTGALLIVAALVLYGAAAVAVALRLRSDRRTGNPAAPAGLPRQLTHRDWQYDQHGRTW